MKILGIDTSSSNLSLAILGDKDEVFERNIEAGRRLSSIIIESITDIIKKKKMSLDSLDAFAVGLGPGSFTGLRIGIATVKGLALATSKPIIAIPSLDILASSVSENEYQICPIIDAKRQKVYSSIYKTKNNNLVRKNDYLLVDIEKLLKKIKNKTIFLGDGINIYKKIIKDKLGKKAKFIDEESWFPRAGNLVLMAKEKYQKKKFDNSDKLVPLYLYPKECQIRK